MARSRWINSSSMEIRRAVPETKLFTAVLSQAVHDAFSSHVDELNKQAARNFLTSNNENLQTICEMAGRNPQYVCEKIRKKILREKGWNVDVAVDGCRKSYRKNKHLTLP